MPQNNPGPPCKGGRKLRTGHLLTGMNVAPDASDILPPFQSGLTLVGVYPGLPTSPRLRRTRPPWAIFSSCLRHFGEAEVDTHPGDLDCTFSNYTRRSLLINRAKPEPFSNDDAPLAPLLSVFTHSSLCAAFRLCAGNQGLLPVSGRHPSCI